MKIKSILLLISIITIVFSMGYSTESFSIKDKNEFGDTLIKPSDTQDTNDAITIIPKKIEPRIYFTRSAPVFTLQINGNFNYGFGELEFNEGTKYQAVQLLQGQNFGVRTGFGFSILGKLPFARDGNVRLLIISAFAHFKNTELANLISSYGKVKYNIISGGIGLENSFIPRSKVKPYVYGALTANAIWGEASNIINTDGSVLNIKIKPSFRIGFILSSGIELLLSNSLGLNLGINITDANRILKQSEWSANSNEIKLRDKKIDPKLPLSGYKQFIYTSLSLGFNFYFGIEKKVIRL